jgi:OmpA-OmpF porin, OOP family
MKTLSEKIPGYRVNHDDHRANAMTHLPISIPEAVPSKCPRMLAWLVVASIGVTFSACTSVRSLNVPTPVDQLPSAQRQQDRITDGAIKADRKYLASLQVRLAAINSRGRSAGDYYLSQATAWLDFATEEYTDNDRSGIVERVLERALGLIQKMENNPASLIESAPPDFPMVGSQKVRPDLWARFTASKTHTDFACVAAKVAQGEVQLVWAGHEELEGGWRHAKPYLEIAETLASQVELELVRCEQRRQVATPQAIQPASAPDAARASLPAQAKAPLASPESVEFARLSSDALFAFDGASLGQLVPEGRDLLGNFVARLRQVKSIERIVITGHSDRLGASAYNLRLSESRAAAIKQFLIVEGFSADVIQAAGAGESDPLVTCSGDRASPELRACLQPNRRVEVRVKVRP